jgi:hypothetical protein
MNILQNAALDYSAAGFATLPVNTAKRPTVEAWTHYQHTKPSQSEISNWFNGSKPETTGLAIIAGKVSGNVEVLDIDCKYDLTGALMEDFCSLVKEHLPELFAKLVIAKTVNKGFHVLFRVPVESIQGNKKLASRPAVADEAKSGDKVKVLIETRGDGGYIVAAPTAGYEWAQGTFKEIPLITANERDTLFTIARSFDQMPVKTSPEQKRQTTEPNQKSSDVSAFEDYNERADIPALLESNGWKFSYQRGERIHYKRPGTTDSATSANFHTGLKLFYVFSTSTEFEAGRGYNPVQVYTQLEHSGDYSAASRALYAGGYGLRRNSQTGFRQASDFRNETGSESKSTNDSNREEEFIPLRAVRMSDVKAEDVTWLWYPFLALQTFNLLEGEEGVGKTFLVCALACAVGLGKGLPGIATGEHIEASNVLLVSAEDSLSHVLKPRLEAMDAPCDKIIAIDEPFTFDEKGLIQLSAVLAQYDPRLVVIDPLFSYTGRINLDRDNDIRAITDKLKRLAEKHNCCIVGIRHIGKSKGLGDARNAGLNGVGWRASARSALLIGKHPENEKQKALCQTKNNLAPKFEKSIGFEIVGNQFFWTGESTLTAATMLSAIRSETSEEKSEKHDAMSFLRETLRLGQKPAQDVQTEAKKIGISEATLRRAKAALNVKSIKDSTQNGKWFWFIEDVQSNGEDAHKENVEHLRVNTETKATYINNLGEDVQDNTFEHLQAKNEHLEQENDGETEYFD